MSAPGPCQAVELVAPDLALGLLSGDERSATLGHLERCERCRALVEDLARAVDRLLLTAPGAEPPEGFECRALDAIAGVAAATSRPSSLVRRLWRRRARAVAAGLAGAAALVAVAVLAADPFADDAGDGIVAVTMQTARGRDVGHAYLSDTEPSWVFVSVPNWRVWEDDEDEVDPNDRSRPPGTGYRLRLELVGGQRQELEIGSLVTGEGAWGTTVDIDADQVRAVAVVGEDGRVWCEAEVPGS